MASSFVARPRHSLVLQHRGGGGGLFCRLHEIRSSADTGKVIVPSLSGGVGPRLIARRVLVPAYRNGRFCCAPAFCSFSGWTASRGAFSRDADPSGQAIGVSRRIYPRKPQFLAFRRATFMVPVTLGAPRGQLFCSAHVRLASGHGVGGSPCQTRPGNWAFGLPASLLGGSKSKVAIICGRREPNAGGSRQRDVDNPSTCRARSAAKHEGTHPQSKVHPVSTTFTPRLVWRTTMRRGASP